MTSAYDVFLKCAQPLVLSPPDAPADRQLRIGSRLVKTHSALIEHVPVLAALAQEQGSAHTVSLSPLLSEQPCLTKEGLVAVLDLIRGAPAHVKPGRLADVLAAALALEQDDLLAQAETELVRLAQWDDSIFFAMEHAALNMTADSPQRAAILEEACARLGTLAALPRLPHVAWRTFEALMKMAARVAVPADFMAAFVAWVAGNRHDQTRACSLLVDFSPRSLSAAERAHYMKKAASLYLHSVSATMAALSGCVPHIESALTHRQRWATCSDLSAGGGELSVSSSDDVIACHEAPHTAPLSVDCSQLSSIECCECEKSLRHLSMGDEGQFSVVSSMESAIGDSCYDDFIQEEGCRMGAGAEDDDAAPQMTARSSTAHSVRSLDSRSFDARPDHKMVDFGLIPIPDGEGLKHITLGFELEDSEQAVQYIRKMRFHFDIEVDAKKK